MYARRLGGRELTFDFAAGLIEDNLLIVDRETRSVWSQLAGKAVAGPMSDTPLEALPSIQTTWGFWRSVHPGTSVMLLEGEEGQPYVYRRAGSGPPAKGAPQLHDTHDLGLGLTVGGESWFFPLRELAMAETPITAVIAGEPVTIHYRPEAMTAWAENAAGDLMVAVLAYESGWLSFSPESEIFAAAPEEVR